MKRKAAKANGRSLSPVSPRNGSPNGGRAPLSGNPAAEQQLVDECLAGQEHAWEELIFRYDEHLRLRIRSLLGTRSRDTNVIDELVAEVWSTLFRKNGSLLGRFAADAGQQLSAFLGGVARIEVLRYLRCKYQRRCHETSAATTRRSSEAEDDEQYHLIALGMEDFIRELTPREREFFQGNLLNGEKYLAQNYLTSTNRWQLSHRIRRKLLAFLSES